MAIVKRVLNVGGNSKSIPLLGDYHGWEQVMLDIDPRSDADIVCDACELSTLPAETFDSVYCSQNLEHYHRHHGLKVLRGFLHVLKEDGFAFIIVPDIGSLMRFMVSKDLDIDDVLYRTGNGRPILARDVIYGLGTEIESTGNDFFAHKNGFTQKSLNRILSDAGFAAVYTGTKGWLDVMAIAFKNTPNQQMYAHAQSTLKMLFAG